MAYCGPRGLPHSFFLGGPHRWTHSDREKALAWTEQQRQTCNSCGTRSQEWDPTQGGDRHAYIFEPSICPGCEQRERQEAFMNDGEWAQQRGKQIRARKRAPTT